MYNLAIPTLKKYSTDNESFEKVLAHVKAVQKVALRIASKFDDVDLEIIKIGSLLHDIGRFKCGKDYVKNEAFQKGYNYSKIVEVNKNKSVKGTNYHPDN